MFHVTEELNFKFYLISINLSVYIKKPRVASGHCIGQPSSRTKGKFVQRT